MCGRLNIADPQKLSNLLAEFEITLQADDFLSGRFKRATDHLSILTAEDNQIALTPAIWWLLLERTETGFKASKYTSFNTRYDKLHVPRSAGYKAYRESRCIIPVNGFGESEYVNRKPVHYHDMVGAEQPLLLGGLTRTWHHQGSGKIYHSCSVITKPPHPKLKHIHSKSMPLILPQDKSLVYDWLNPRINDVEQFEFLLEPFLPQDLIAMPIAKPSTYQAVGPSQRIARD
jgi:putative SOS response-associated peptidase YedK